MEFDDLFKTNRPPKDYVNKKQQEPRNLEQFFAERTLAPKPDESNYNMFGSKFLETPAKPAPRGEPKEVAQPIKPELQAVAEAAPKLDNETLAKAKAMFQMQPEMGDMQQVQQTSIQEKPVSNSDLVNVGQVKSQTAEMMGPDTTTQDLAVGAIPIVMDLLMNKGRGDGMGVSAKYYGDKVAENTKRKNTLEDKLMDISKARQLASLKATKGEAGKLYETVGPNGEPIFQTREQAIGDTAWKAPKSGVDRGEIARLGREQSKALADRQAILSTRDKLVANKTFQGARARFQATNDAVDVLNQRNPVGDAGVQILFAKGIFGEVGNLTAQEQAKFIGSPELERTFNRMVEKYKNGTLAEEDRASLLKLATHMRKRAKEVAGEVASGYTSGLKSLDIDPSGVIEPLLSGREVNPEYSKKEKYVRQGGRVYTLDESTGEYK